MEFQIEIDSDTDTVIRLSGDHLPKRQFLFQFQIFIYVYVLTDL